jgi:cytochrome oxidase Cu insertion factor (SCO1/SenC/PrrC family)
MMNLNQSDLVSTSERSKTTGRRWLFLAAPLVGLVVLGLLVAWLSFFNRSEATHTKATIAYEGTRLEGLAPDFQLVDQRGTSVALSDFRRKVVALAFLDPKCTDACPVTANEFRLTSEALGRNATRVAFLVVNVNPTANSVADVAAATERWGVQELPGWHYLTGSREALESIYQAYHVLVEGPPKPDKPDELQHTPGVYLIDKAGKKRWYVSTAFDPSRSLSELLVKHIHRLLA